MKLKPDTLDGEPILPGPEEELTEATVEWFMSVFNLQRKDAEALLSSSD